MKFRPVISDILSSNDTKAHLLSNLFIILSKTLKKTKLIHTFQYYKITSNPKLNTGPLSSILLFMPKKYKINMKNNNIYYINFSSWYFVSQRPFK